MNNEDFAGLRQRAEEYTFPSFEELGTTNDDDVAGRSALLGLAHVLMERQDGKVNEDITTAIQQHSQDLDRIVDLGHEKSEKSDDTIESLEQEYFDIMNRIADLRRHLDVKTETEIRLSRIQSEERA